jgi:membrane-bound lytic murein transglycosylase MltF
VPAPFLPVPLLVAAALVVHPVGAPRTPSAPAPTPAGGATSARAVSRAAARYDDTFKRYAKRFFGAGFDWRWFKAQGMAESNLDSAATSPVGARGIMQLMPSTYRAIQSKDPALGAIDDPEWNIAAGIRHDRYLWRLWSSRVNGGDDHLAFMFGSYNAGEGTIGRAAQVAQRVAGGAPGWAHVEQVAPEVARWRYRETLGYVRKIRSHHAAMRAR